MNQSYKKIFEAKQTYNSKLQDKIKKRSKFDPIKYLQNQPSKQIYQFKKKLNDNLDNKMIEEELESSLATEKEVQTKKTNILQKFRESGKKHKLQSLKSIDDDSLKFEHESLEFDLYKDILNQFSKTDLRKKPSLKNFRPKRQKIEENESLKNFMRIENKTTLSSKESSKHHIKIDIRNLSEKVQFSLKDCFRK